MTTQQFLIDEFEFCKDKDQEIFNDMVVIELKYFPLIIFSFFFIVNMEIK